MREGPSEILFNAVDTRRFWPAQESARADGSVTFLITGKVTVDRFYRIDGSLRALAVARSRGFDARLLIAGWIAPDAAKAAADLAAELDLGSVVTINGPYTQDGAPEIYRAADIYLAVQHQDPCPNAVLEALASGLPVIYSDTGGTPELVGDAAGVAVACAEDWEKPRLPDAGEVAAAMVRAATHRQAMAAEARRRAVERFDIAHWIARHDAVFRRLLEAHA